MRRPLLGLRPHWDSHTPGLRTPCSLRALLLLHLRLLEHFLLLLRLRLLEHFLLLLHALLLLCTLSNSCCLGSSLLVFKHPCSQSLHPSGWACSVMGASLGSAWGGVLACLHCSPSSGEDCHLATVWSKRCWRWRSKSLTVANGSGIGATDCTGMSPAILACLAWFINSLRSGSLS